MSTLTDVIQQCDEAMQRGEALDVDALCLKHPGLPKLRDHLAVLMSLQEDLSELFGGTQPLGPPPADAIEVDGYKLVERVGMGGMGGPGGLPRR